MEAKELQRRLTEAVKVAEPEDLDEIRRIAKEVSALKKKVENIVTEPQQDRLEEQCSEMLSEFTQKLYRALRQRLAPSEWQRVRDIVQEVTGEEPH